LRASLTRFVPTPMQLLALVVAALGLCCLGFIVWFWVTHAPAGAPGRDVHNYILAGLRLNAGHPLYSYGPGDERIPGADYALYSPPLIAVLFRPIVLLPANGQYLWWIAMIALELLTVAMLVRRAPFITGLALIPLSVPVGVLLEFGNVDCLVAFGMVAGWRWLVNGHDDRAAMLIAVLASLKLTPVVFVWWLFVTGRRRAAAVAIGGGVALAFVAMLGSEPLIMAKFVQVTTTNLSLTNGNVGPAGLAYVLGLPSSVGVWLPRVILVSGVAAMWVLRRWPGISFALGAWLMWLVSPVASIHSPAIVLVALAPLAWPMVRGRVGGRSEASPVATAPVTASPSATPEPAHGAPASK